MKKKTIMKNMGLSILLSTCALEAHGMEQPRREHDGMVIGDRHLRVGDGESAMDRALNEQIMTCFTVIYNFPDLNETAIENAYYEVIDFVDSPDKKNIERPKPKIVQNVNGVFVVTGEGPLYADRLMYNNALKTLTDTGFRGSISQNFDYLNCPTDLGPKMVRMKELLARVWVLINTHKKPLDVRLMKDNLFANLNYCVEDNGHLTCDDGKTKRLIASIEGYFPGISLTAVLPEPAGFCSQYDTEFFQHLGENHPNDPLNFAITLGVPDNFSLADLENRIVREREVVRLRINGLYGAGSVKANATIRLMESYFERWRQTYNAYAPIRSVNGAVPSVAQVNNVDVPVTNRVSENANAASPVLSHDQARLTELLQMIEDVGYEVFIENQNLASELERLMTGQASVTAVQERRRPRRGVREEQQPEVIRRAEVAAQEVLDAETRAQRERFQAAAGQLNAQPANPNRPVRERPGVQRPGNLRQTAATRPTGVYLPAWLQSLMQPAGQQLTPKQAKAAQKALARQAKRDAAQVKKAQKAQDRQAKRIAAQIRKAQKIVAKQAKKAAAQVLKAQKVAQKAAQRLAARHGIAA